MSQAESPVVALVKRQPLGEGMEEIIAQRGLETIEVPEAGSGMIGFCNLCSSAMETIRTIRVCMPTRCTIWP